MSSIVLKPLADQVIVITGASSGIGLATARLAARRGASVVLVARSIDAMRNEVAAITAAGGTADAIQADVGDPAQVEAAAAFAVQRFGRIDTWVNNAGSVIYARLIDTPDDEHEQLFRTNYFGAVHGCRAAIPHLRETGGALVTVGSIGSDLPTPVMGAYSATKHALKAYVETLRMELQDDGLPIAVSLIKPAGIDTPIGQHAANHMGKGEAQIPPPIYDPALVAEAILHCATHEKREITVGGLGRAQVLFGVHFKSIMEKIAPKAAKNFTDPSKPQPQPPNLFEGANAGRVHSGEHPHRRRTSLYTAALQHPKTTAVGIGAVAAGVAAVLFANGGRKKL